MERLELNVVLRTTTGKGSARKSRTLRQIPGVFYGPHMDKPQTLNVDEIEFSRIRVKSTANTIYVLKEKDQSNLVHDKLAILKEIQKNPVTEKAEHIDFYELRENEKMKVFVPLVMSGKSVGVAEGGIMQQIRRTLGIRCLPKDIPLKIEVDVSALKIGDSLHISDIKLPSGLAVVGGVHHAIVAVVPPEEEKVQAQTTAGAVEPTLVEKKGAALADAAKGAAPAAKAPAAKAEAKPAEKKAEAKK